MSKHACLISINSLTDKRALFDLSNIIGGFSLRQLGEEMIYIACSS